MKRLQYRIATAAEFTSKNPILAKDEIGIERDTGKEKIGDGTSQWSALSYFADSATNNVASFGAVGDGIVDDTSAVEAAILAAGEGGVVYFPPGRYLVSRTLWPEHGQTWTGTHTTKYNPREDPDSTCVLEAASTFAGRALVERKAGVNGVLLERLCFLGNGWMSTPSLDGIHLGDMSSERSWKVQESTVHGFSNYGVTGRLHVFDMRDCHIVRNGYGLRVTGANSLTDVRIFGCQFYYNLNGGLCLDSTSRRNGMVSIHGCRFERSGSTPNNPSVNLNTYAPGVRIQYATNIDLVQCSTDANSGPGLELLGDPADDLYTYGITVDACKFARDGGGDQSAGVQLPGVKIKGCFHVYFSSNVTWGLADDDGGGVLISPYYSLWIEDSPQCKVTRSWIAAPIPSNSVHLVGNNAGTSIDGAASYMDFVGTDTQNKEIRFRLDDGAGDTVTRWVTGVNPTAYGGTYSLQRYDALGGYVDSPINVRWSDGLVMTSQMYVTNKDNTKTAMEVRAASVTPAASYFTLAMSDGTKVFEVQYNGRVRSNWGSAMFGATQMGCTQIVREGATGSNTLLACYTSVASADADSPVFEVRPSGVQIPEAGLEFGTSGPREMVGTGSPEGAVTAPAGSVWRQTDHATFGYVRWIKGSGTGNTGWLLSPEGRIWCEGRRTSNQSISDVTSTVITYTAETDRWNMLNTGTGKITLPVAGLWGFSAQISWATDFANWQHASILNETASVTVASLRTASGPYQVSLSGVLSCAANDVMSVSVFQDSTGAQNVGYARFNATLVGT